jgi:hypothetical protein
MEPQIEAIEAFDSPGGPPFVHVSRARLNAFSRVFPGVSPILLTLYLMECQKRPLLFAFPALEQLTHLRAH